MEAVPGITPELRAAAAADPELAHLLARLGRGESDALAGLSRRVRSLLDAGQLDHPLLVYLQQHWHREFDSAWVKMHAGDRGRAEFLLRHLLTIRVSGKTRKELAELKLDPDAVALKALATVLRQKAWRGKDGFRLTGGGDGRGLPPHLLRFVAKAIHEEIGRQIQDRREEIGDKWDAGERNVLGATEDGSLPDLAADVQVEMFDGLPSDPGALLEEWQRLEGLIRRALMLMPLTGRALEVRRRREEGQDHAEIARDLGWAAVNGYMAQLERRLKDPRMSNLI